ncbi:MAG: PilX N-terminal domain-containing pilus assembly protein [Marinobacter sp.]|uniref:pilus assembly PilX family protein n=1 Tax=Marinobacter sp. TaxID=50741 RepID=UPI00299EA85D|nr:PilX N-terminal domain-containing pilus assembly protein [Marinobacter sp.]MDX1757273.1 PilX N-terminal domain-containing pilus assembly protein [Marinobacter sp.]
MKRIEARQRGAALILSLLMLLVLSLLAISSMQGTVLQERMVSAEREGMSSLEIAESGVRDAEIVLEGISTLSTFDGTNGLYGPDDTAPDPTTHDWASGSGVMDATAVDGVTPKFYIQHMGDANQPDRLTDIVVEGYTHETGSYNSQAFRVVAWSPGSSGEAQRVIETYYARDM